MPSSPPCLPLRWESTGDQWWYATPIDWAAANGLSDLVKQILRTDPNLLIKLTSLRRTRRLESVWDDADPTNGVARCRARTARDLLLGCKPKDGGGGPWENPLIRAGYGGWLLYTAASAGDVGFVKELVEKEGVSVFGEGEYGITDVLYAAARSKNAEVFRVLYELAMDAVKSNGGGNDGGNCNAGDDGVLLCREMKNRAVHAAARGGNLEVLRELLRDCDDVLEFRDAEGCTVLHSAASRGQVEMVEDLIATHNHLIVSTDNQGNTALHIAAYRGHFSVVEALTQASPSLAKLTNNDGDAFLHFAVAGFRSPGFHQINQQLNLMKKLATGDVVNLKDIINIRNNEGKTVLHAAVSDNVPLEVVQLLMGVRSIDLNVCDVDGFTPLDILKQSPKTPTSEILIRQIASAGGISYCHQDHNNSVRNPLIGNLIRVQGIGTSPGTSFRVPDAELCNGDDYGDHDNESQVSCEPPSSGGSSSGSGERGPTSHLGSPRGFGEKRVGSSRFKQLLLPLWTPKRSEKREDIPTPLREKYSSIHSNSVKERFAASLMQGVIQTTPPKSCFSSPFSNNSLTCSPSFREKYSTETNNNSSKSGNIGGRLSFFSGPLSLSGRKSRGDDKHRRTSSFSKSVMNQYFCFGAQGLVVEDPVGNRPGERSCRRLVF